MFEVRDEYKFKVEGFKGKLIMPDNNKFIYNTNAILRDIDEIEFRDKNGNEIEPTKNQLVIYIKSLHKQIKDLKETQKEFAVSRLEELFYGLQEEKYTTIFGAQEEPIQVLERSQVLDYINNRIEKLKGELK